MIKKGTENDPMALFGLKFSKMSEMTLNFQDFDWKSKNTENALNILTDQLRKINNHDLNQILDDKFTLIQKLTYNK